MPRGGGRPRDTALWTAIRAMLAEGLTQKAIIAATGRRPGTVSTIIRAVRAEHPDLPQARVQTPRVAEPTAADFPPESWTSWRCRCGRLVFQRADRCPICREPKPREDPDVR